MEDQPRGDIPRVPQAPRDVPEVDTDTRGQKNPIYSSESECIVITFLRMDNHPVGWPLLYETPLGMFCLYGKVMQKLDPSFEGQFRI